MIVLDASAAVELLLGLPLADRVRAELDRAEWLVAAPQLLVVEVPQVMRRRVAAGITPVESAERGLEIFGEWGIRYYDHHDLADRIWRLRENLTAYDAAYVALAEALDAVLLTTDLRLARAPGHAARTVAID